MTWAMHTIGFLDLQDEEQAAKYMARSYTNYTREPFKVWFEVVPGNPTAGNFITGAGGFLQSVINGYAGIRLNFDYLRIKESYLPEGTTSLELKGITYLNNIFSLSIYETNKTFSLLRFDPTHEVSITVDGMGQGRMLEGDTFTVARNSEIILRPRAETCQIKETIIGLEAVENPVPVVVDDWTLGANS